MSAPPGSALTHPRPTASQQRSKVATYLRLGLGLVGVMLLAAVTALSISRLAHYQKSDGSWTTSASADGRLSLARDGDGFRLDVHEGSIQFANGSSPWVGPSRLLIGWASMPDGIRRASYLVNIAEGKFEQLPGYESGMSVVSRDDGKRVVLTQRGDNNSVHIKLSNLETGDAQTVFSSNPAIVQWAGGDAAHRWDIWSTPVYADAIWVSESAFVIRLMPRAREDANIRDWGTKLLLADIEHRQVRVLAERGTLAETFPNGILVWQSGWVDGGLQMLFPPYTEQPRTLTPGGPWIRDWVLSPDGRKVAWVEAVAPDGDWSRKLPFTCRPCGGKDPEPSTSAIAVWDSKTGQTDRFPAANLVWSFSETSMARRPGLRWSNDSAGLLYATHIHNNDGAENAGTTSLFKLALDGGSTLLAEHKWYGNLEILWEGDDKSVYYYVMGEKYVAAGDIVRRYPDGRLEVIEAYPGWMNWSVDDQGRLETLNGNGVLVRDLSTGQTRRAIFPQRDASEFDMGWSSIQQLVPLSPDGQWAAFAGSNSDLIDSERGRLLSIARVK